MAGRLTDKPVRYLVNTTYHGDHTFGNAAFGSDVTIFSSRGNKAAMSDVDSEKRIRAESMYGDERVLENVRYWRRPDVTFDRFCEVDLGGRVVHLWHFGPGNGFGDTIVHVPDAKVAWTGNLVMPAGLGAMLLIGDPVSYARTLRAMIATIDVDTLVPGHGFLGSAEPGVSMLIAYLEQLAAAVARGKAAGVPVSELYELPMWGMTPPPSTPDSVLAVLKSLHRLNILLTYRTT